MIPDLNQDGILPPFLPESAPTSPAATSPYLCSMIELAERFTYSPERKRIFLGLLNFREAMRSAGLTQGFQWIDGSFLEDCERIRGRAPNDIDLVTFFERPQAVSDSESWKKFADFHKDLFLNSKAKYCCDAYFVDLTVNLKRPAKAIVSSTHYWFGLFSHQRETTLWKGLLQVSLLDDSEENARRFIDGGDSDAS